MSRIGTTCRQAFIQCSLRIDERLRRNVEAESTEPGRSYHYEKRFVRDDAGCDVVHPSANDRSAGKRIEVHSSRYKQSDAHR